MILRRIFSMALAPALIGLTASAFGADAMPGSDEPVETTVEASAELPQPAVAAPGKPVENPNVLQRLWSWSDARVRGVFDYILPDTQEKHTWRLSVQPRVGDLIKRDHVRLPVSTTYGFNKRAEGEFGLDPYFTNPFKGDGRGQGVANIRASFKYQWVPALDAKVRAATGVQMVHPLSSAPYDFNDGVNRYSIYTTLARPSPWNPNLEGFMNLSYDLITPSTAVGEIDDDDPQDDFVKIGTGVLWRNQRLTYGLALGFAHTVDGEMTAFTTVTPSIIYDVPRRFAFNSRGKWQLGASVEGKRYGNETALNFKVRVRWQVDFRRMLRDWRDTRARARLQASTREP